MEKHSYLLVDLVRIDLESNMPYVCSCVSVSPKVRFASGSRKVSTRVISKKDLHNKKLFVPANIQMLYQTNTCIPYIHIYTNLPAHTHTHTHIYAAKCIYHCICKTIYSHGLYTDTENIVRLLVCDLSTLQTLASNSQTAYVCTV